MILGEFLGRIREKHRLRIAVKEALDTLPSAVCYFTSGGTIKLCNTAMYSLFRKITQRDLQSYSELKEALEGCDKSTGMIRDRNVFVFPDGRAWNYSEGEVRTASGEVYTEAVFSDVTELYEKRRELQKQSGELKNMYRELKTLSENVLEMTREQEILNLKSRLHDQMNMGVSAIRQILRQNTTSEKNAAAVMQFRRAIQVLQEENACSGDDLEEFIQDAAVSGIRVEITGDLPEEEDQLHLLLQVMREACVNAARHADASALYIAVEYTDSGVTLCITNDGKRPEAETIPRGGLADLGRCITRAGGSMEIQSLPAFVLKVTLPLNTKNKEQEATV
ncbi:MAG: hypothetical protein ACI4WS_10550 [Oscillospiraceae bacterium]